MNRTYIQEVPKEIGNTIKVQGFIENLRNSKAMAFIVLKDITGKLQITVEKADHPELVDTIDKLTPDSVITVTGKVVSLCLLYQQLAQCKAIYDKHAETILGNMYFVRQTLWRQQSHGN